MMETRARDGNVLGMSRSVPSSPGERQSPSDREGVAEIETSEQRAQMNSGLPVISVWSGQPGERTNTICNSLLYRQATLESPCYQPSPHHRHPYHAVSPTTSPQSPRTTQDRTVTFASPPSQVEIVPTVQILEFSPSPSLASDCSTETQ